MPKWFEAKTVAQAEALRESGMTSVRVNVCWKCGSGGHNKTTLYRTGTGPDRQAIYGCANHRGLVGQTAGTLK